MRTALIILGFVGLLVCGNVALQLLGFTREAASSLSGLFMFTGIGYGIYRLTKKWRKPRAYKAPGH